MPLSWRWHLQYRQAAGALYQWAALLVFLLVAWWLCSVPPASAAEGAAVLSGVRHRVFRWAGAWWVEEVRVVS